MKRLTKGAPIVEQTTADYCTLAIPKEYMKMTGLLPGNTMFFSIHQHKPRLIIKYADGNHLGITRPRKIIGYKGYYRLSIPIKAEFKHGAGTRWECFEERGDLYYAMLPEIKL